LHSYFLFTRGLTIGVRAVDCETLRITPSVNSPQTAALTIGLQGVSDIIADATDHSAARRRKI
uniref:hypothetical protein n=1 Tax=Pararhodobacter sp. TaxID=2127056 RepID=UPI002FE10C6C